MLAKLAYWKKNNLKNLVKENERLEKENRKLKKRNRELEMRLNHKGGDENFADYLLKLESKTLGWLAYEEKYNGERK